MLLLAAKFGLLTLVNRQEASGELAMWRRLRTSVATLVRKGAPVGTAAFISADGYAVANSLIIQKGATELITDSGLTYKIRVVSTDSISQLTLIKTTTQPAGITFVRPAEKSDGEKGTVYAIMPNKVLKGDLTGTEKIGIDQKTKRTFPIQEIRVEQPALQMGGALLFSQNGRLIGGLFAALAQESTYTAAPPSVADLAQNAQKAAQGTVQQNQNLRNFGPQGMVVGYSPTWEVTSKAIAGFLTPERKAQYGLLGVFIIDNKFGGVEIQSLTKDGSADLAGLEVGDVIIDINRDKIRKQIDFSRAIYKLVPGTTIPIQVRRKAEILTILVTIGYQQAQADGHPLSSTEPNGFPEIR